MDIRRVKDLMMNVVWKPLCFGEKAIYKKGLQKRTIPKM